MGSTQSGFSEDNATSIGASDIPQEMRSATTFVMEMGGAELLQKIVSLFCSTAVERMHELRSAGDAGDRERVRRLAHAMKGSAAQVGAEMLRSAAAQIEGRAASQPWPDLVSEIDALSHLVERACTMLQLTKSSLLGAEPAE